MKASNYKTADITAIGWDHNNNQRICHEYLLPGSTDNPLTDYPDSDSAVEKLVKAADTDEGSKHRETKRGLVTPLFVTGWNPIEVLMVRKIDKTDIATQDRLRANLEALVKAYDADAKFQHVADTIRDLYQFDDTGKCQHVFQFEGLSGYRRSLALPAVASLARRMNNSDRAISQVSIVVLDNPKDIEKTHLLENLLKTAGQAKLTPNAMAVSAIGLERAGSCERESHLQRFGFNRGQAQRYWAIVQLNSRFPGLNLEARLRMEPATDDEGNRVYSAGGWIDAATLNKDALCRMAKLDEKGEPREADPVNNLPAYAQTADDVEGYIAGRMTGETGAKTPQTMTRRTMIEAVSAIANPLVAATIQAVINDSLGELKRLGKIPASEGLAEAIQSGKGVEAGVPS